MPSEERSRDIFLRMVERYGDESPEAVYAKERSKDLETRQQIHRMTEARFAEERAKKRTEAARMAANRTKPKMFRDETRKEMAEDTGEDVYDPKDYVVPSSHKPKVEVFSSDQEGGSLKAISDHIIRDRTKAEKAQNLVNIEIRPNPYEDTDDDPGAA